METKSYGCPTCKKPIETNVPEKSMVNPEKGYWDSLVQCPHCEELNFKIVWPGGKIEATPMRGLIPCPRSALRESVDANKFKVAKK